MRFLVDAQLPPALARQIETLGHSADHVFDWGLSNCEARRASGALHGVLSEPAAAGRLLRIHVERFNPALRLYERLGFRQIDDRGVYLFMEWRGHDNSQLPTPNSQGESLEPSG